MVVALSLSATTLASVTAQDQASVGVDADSAGNTATSLGDLQHCRRVEVNDAFQIDVYGVDIPGVVGFEFTVNYDPTILEVTAAKTEFLLAANQGSQIVDFTDDPTQDGNDADQIPDGHDGSFTVAATDFGPAADESGSGVLAAISLRALANGVSTLALSNVKLLRTGANGSIIPVEPIGYSEYFVGTGANANIGVGEGCTPPLPTTLEAPTPAPTSSPSPGASGQTPEASGGSPAPSTEPGAEDGGNASPGQGTNTGGNQVNAEGGDDTWIIVVGVVAGVALVSAAGAFVWQRRRRT